MATTVVVLDTGILYAAPQPRTITELTDLGNVEFVIPATVLWELDQLMDRRETRAPARAALNVLEGLTSRGASKGPVTCGDGKTLRVAKATEREPNPELDEGLADDRIIATALYLSGSGTDPVCLATTDFAVHAKALSLDVESLYLPRYKERPRRIEHRDARRFSFNWEQVIKCETRWEVCRRGITFCAQPIIREVLTANPNAPEAAFAIPFFDQFDSLSRAWGENVDVDTVMLDSFGLAPPTRPNLGVITVTEPGEPWRFGGKQTVADREPKVRSETADERALRLAIEQQAYQDRQSYVVDVLKGRLETVREYVIDQVGEDLT